MPEIENGIYATIRDRGREVDVRVLDVRTLDADPLLRQPERKVVDVQALNGKPFREQHVQISDPKRGGGGVHEWRTDITTVSLLAVVTVWEIQDGTIEILGPPPICVAAGVV